MKKGFTLVELLAVVIILGILALVTIPIITGSIEKSRQKAMLDSASKYMEAVNEQIISNQMRTSKYKKINSGIYDIPLSDEYGVSFKGQAPIKGWFLVDDNKIVEYSLVFDKKYLINYNGKKQTIKVNKRIKPLPKPEIN